MCDIDNGSSLTDGIHPQVIMDGDVCNGGIVFIIVRNLIDFTRGRDILLL